MFALKMMDIGKWVRGRRGRVKSLTVLSNLKKGGILFGSNCLGNGLRLVLTVILWDWESRHGAVENQIVSTVKKNINKNMTKI